MDYVVGFNIQELEGLGINPGLFTCQDLKTPTICSFKKEIEEFKKEIEKEEEHTQQPNKVVHKSKKVKYVQKILKPRWKRDLYIDSFRDPILTEVDVDNYHSYLKDEASQSLVHDSIYCTRSQVSQFTHQTKKFIAITWLSTVRIYEHCLKSNKYVEIKRVPDRYIELNPKILTSIHFDNQPRLYMAYLWGSTDVNADPTKPFIEIRDVTGGQIGHAHFYDSPITDIDSDSLFIYVTAKSNKINLHRKKCFNMLYSIDFSPHIQNQIIKFYLEKPQCDSITKLPIVTITSKEMKLTNYSRHTGPCLLEGDPYRTNDDYKILMVEKVRRNFVVLAQAMNPVWTEFPSIIDILSLSGKTGSFTNNHCIQLKSNVIQMKAYKDCLYILGHQGQLGQQVYHEVSCIRLRNKPEPLWTTYVTSVDEKSQLVVHSEHVAITTSAQNILVVNTALRKKAYCDTCKIQLLNKQDMDYHVKVHNSLFTGCTILGPNN